RTAGATWVGCACRWWSRYPGSAPDPAPDPGPPPGPPTPRPPAGRASPPTPADGAPEREGSRPGERVGRVVHRLPGDGLPRPRRTRPGARRRGAAVRAATTTNSPISQGVPASRAASSISALPRKVPNGGTPASPRAPGDNTTGA